MIVVKSWCLRGVANRFQSIDILRQLLGRESSQVGRSRRSVLQGSILGRESPSCVAPTNPRNVAQS